MAVIEVVVGNITRQHVDAIVTAANESLLGGGGVDGAVHRAAGPRLAQAGGAIGPCEPGDAMATPAFDLDPPVRHVIHTVGPIWEGGGHGEADVLASCYRRSLAVADQLSARSVAFPAIATGVDGFPPEQAARIAVTTIRATPTNVEQIRLVAFDDTTRDLLQKAFGALTTRRRRATRARFPGSTNIRSFREAPRRAARSVPEVGSGSSRPPRSLKTGRVSWKIVTTFDDLVALVPPPTAPIAGDGDWTVVEQALGVGLPRDFQALVRRYGLGQFADITLLTPFGTRAD